MMTRPHMPGPALREVAGSALRWIAGFDPFGAYAPGLPRRRPRPPRRRERVLRTGLAGVVSAADRVLENALHQPRGRGSKPNYLHEKVITAAM
jgi:hypothetical protein